MAYATGGSGGNMTDLMDALRVFALAQGWTIDKWDAGNRLLFMTKGLCAVSMFGSITETVRIYSGANNSGIFTDGNTDHRLRFALNTNNNAALATYHSHPGSVVTSNTDSDAPYSNFLQGPFVAWHFFADATVSDHIHCVVQTGAETYSHFSIGHVDKKGLTHSGVAYVAATPNTWYRNVSNYLSTGGNPFNHSQFQSYHFLFGNLNNSSHAPACTGEGEGTPIILKHANAWPVGWSSAGALIVGSNFVGGMGETILGLFNGDAFSNPAAWPSGSEVSTSKLLDLLLAAEPTSYSNNVPLFALPVFRYFRNTADATSRRICYVGDFPNVRACNMTNLIPGQEITLAGDTFKVFPCLRQASYADNSVVPQPTTGQIAIAYKKVA